ncbi:MAG TPA: hypothetical protein VIG24_12905 [Acidimicrobiia bacterium]
MQVKDLAEQLNKMVELGKGEFDLVHVMGNGVEKEVLGFEVVEHGFFSAGPVLNGTGRGSEISRKRRERSRVRLFTHSPF